LSALEPARSARSSSAGTPLGKNIQPRLNRRDGFEPVLTDLSDAVEEEVNRSRVGHMGIAQHLDGMLELVADRRE
jgi:hypothetical protein